MIFPARDEAFSWKMAGLGETEPVFGLAERVHLWQGDLGSEWYWTYPGSEFHQFKSSFQASLLEAGFQVEFDKVCEPDGIHDEDASQNGNYWGGNIVVSDIAREACFTSSSSGSPLDFPGFYSRESVEVDADSINKVVREKVSVGSKIRTCLDEAQGMGKVNKLTSQ